MPRSQRKLNKRTLDQCRTHTAYIENYLAELETMYAERYPEITKALHAARELNSLLDDMLDKIRMEI